MPQPQKFFKIIPNVLRFRASTFICNKQLTGVFTEWPDRIVFCVASLCTRATESVCRCQLLWMFIGFRKRTNKSGEYRRWHIKRSRFSGLSFTSVCDHMAGRLSNAAFVLAVAVFLCVPSLALLIFYTRINIRTKKSDCKIWVILHRLAGFLFCGLHWLSR